MYTYMYRRIQTHACVSHIRQLGHVCITVTPKKRCQVCPYLSYTAGITTLTHILFVLSPPPLSSLNSRP